MMKSKIATALLSLAAFVATGTIASSLTPHPDNETPHSGMMSGSSRDGIYDGNNESPCSRLEVQVDGFEKALEKALAGKSLHDKLNVTFSVEGPVLSKPATFTATWDFDPSSIDMEGDCPFDTVHDMFTDVLESHESRCKTKIPHHPVWKTYAGCGGRATLVHTSLGPLTYDLAGDDSTTKPYIDGHAGQAATACDGYTLNDDKEKHFRVDDVKPAISKFCNDMFGDDQDNSADMARAPVVQEYGPVAVQDYADEKDAFTTEMIPIYLFAAHDLDGCPEGVETVDWPSAEDCEESLGKALGASGDSTDICQYECDLSQDTETGDWKLDYCENDHEPWDGATMGGYSWDHCLRWGVVSNLHEGILGAIGVEPEPEETSN